MRVICINDSDRPENVPISMWLKKGSVYTVIEEFYVEDNILCYEIEEINIKKIDPRYEGFRADRFAPADTNGDEFSDKDISDLMKEIEQEQFEMI